MDDAPKRPARVIRLDEIEGLPDPDSTLTWHPVRHALGLRAFGTNAYSAKRRGDDVVEPHTETPDAGEEGPGHEELYFVARGRAEFTVDGERIDAPAGTYVFVPDPRSHRHAVAAQDETWVLSFGGPPSFSPSAWEWSCRAQAVAAADPQAARAILEDGLKALPGDPRLAAELASLREQDG